MFLPCPPSHGSSFSVRLRRAGRLQGRLWPKSCSIPHGGSVTASPEALDGKDALAFPHVPYARCCFMAEEGLRAPARPWQAPGLADPDPGPAPGEGIWSPEHREASAGSAAVGDASEDALPQSPRQGRRQPASPALLVFTALFFRRNDPFRGCRVPPFQTSALEAAFPWCRSSSSAGAGAPGGLRLMTLCRTSPRCRLPGG